MSRSVLLLEDEQESAEMLKTFLEAQDFEITIAEDGESAISMLNRSSSEFDAAILDIMVPEPDGIEVCQYIRQHTLWHALPVVFLTAKQQEKDEIQGLEIGADDFIRKPVNPKILAARLESILRRKGNESRKRLQLGNLLLDEANHEAYLGSEKLTLTPTEFRLLSLFLNNPKQAFTRLQILERVYHDQKNVFDRTVDAHVKNLRMKLGSYAAVIKTVRGVGYGFNTSFDF
jgi:two-component system phosphate regulon response regulator PhoB